MAANNPVIDTLTEIEEWNMAVREKGRYDEVFTPTVIVSLGCGKSPTVQVRILVFIIPQKKNTTNRPSVYCYIFLEPC